MKLLRSACALLVIAGHLPGLMAADLIQDDFPSDPRPRGWLLSDWNAVTHASGAWNEEGHLSLPPGYAPFWRSPGFTVQPLEYFRIAIRSRGPVGICGVGYNPNATWGRYPHADAEDWLVADDWTVLTSQPDWQTSRFCTRAAVNSTLSGIRLSGGDVDSVTVESVSRDEVRDWADEIYADMPQLHHTPSPERHLRLQRTFSRLRQGQELTVVLLGDSIMNDTSNSTFDVLLERLWGYDEIARVRAIAAVGGGTGVARWAGDENWTWPQSDLNLQAAVIEQQPDLVIIGGISNGTNYGAFRVLIDRIRTRSSEQNGYMPDILLMTGAFGSTGLDPAGYADNLRALAEEKMVGFMDMRAVWTAYMDAAAQQGMPRTRFYRDSVHANHTGKQFLGRAVMTELAPVPLRISSFDRIADLMRVTWDSEPGVSYSLWKSLSLDVEDWSLVTRSVAEGRSMQADVAIGEQPKAFFRVSSP